MVVGCMAYYVDFLKCCRKYVIGVFFRFDIKMFKQIGPEGGGGGGGGGGGRPEAPRSTVSGSSRQSLSCASAIACKDISRATLPLDLLNF
jgi:hypothetical protein